MVRVLYSVEFNFETIMLMGGAIFIVVVIGSFHILVVNISVVAYRVHASKAPKKSMTMWQFGFDNRCHEKNLSDFIRASRILS